MKKITSLLLGLSALFFSCDKSNSNLPDGMYAEIETDKGTIMVELEYKKTPITVANFVSLAEGKNPVVNEKYKGKPFYDGLKFHRVLPNFMIQGGDPDGNGSGGPGYRFQDEIVPELKHDKGGVLSMANGGKATNGSQFFITHQATPWLDGIHTIFGHVIGNGMEVVNAIQQDDVIKKITIIRKGQDAKKFDAPKIFKDGFAKQAEEQKKFEEEQLKMREKFSAIIKEKEAQFQQLKAQSTKTQSGLQYKIITKGKGKKPVAGTPVSINYAGYFENGDLFDTNIESIATNFGKLDPNRAAAKAYSPIPFTIGMKEGMIPGFIEGIEQLSPGDKAIIFIPSYLAYGERGAGGVIPPNANIIFEIEMLGSTPNQ
ncbi:peptidyl-prolyl cis-trans isomerase A (cyclophilin A) [Flavobacterium sp. 28YEA47A]|uniref:peptidylprolyl isomerase n=1 Tax=Flavobacterium sp. 28YEA47A TaxID=3156276 RepID=UPI0035145555